MSLQKLENYSNKAVVQEEVLILTELLEDITKNMLAPETFEKIMQLKELSTQEDYQGLNQLVTVCQMMKWLIFHAISLSCLS